MTRVKRVSLILAAILAGAFGAVAIEAPAHASAADCGINRFCIWQGPSYTGARYDYRASDYVNQCVFIGGSFNNTTKSLVINASGTVQLFSDSCSAQVITTVNNPNYKHQCGDFSSWNQSVSTCGTPTGSWMFHGA